MTYADGFGIRTINVKFNDVADAIDGVLSRNYTTAVSGTSTLYIALPTPAWTDYDTAAFLIFVPHVTCGASPSIKVSDLPPKAIKKNGVALSAGDIVANIPTLIIYNGTWFELLSLAETSLIPIYLDKVNNRVGINTPSPSYTFHSSFAGSGVDASIDKFQNGDQGAILQLRKSRGATIGTNTIVQSGDALGEIYFAGANGSSYNSGAAIFATVDQAPGASNDMPGRLTFLTTPNGSGTLVERMRISSAGFIGIGTTSPSGLLHVYSNSSTTPQVTIQGFHTTGGGSGKSSLQLDVNGSGGFLLQNDASSGTRAFTISDNNGYGSGTTERLRISNAGYVGINTNNPTSLLHLANTTGDVRLTLESTGGAAYDQSIYFKDTASSWFVGNRYSADSYTFGIGRTASKGDLVFDSSGNVYASNDFYGGGVQYFGTNFSGAYHFLNAISTDTIPRETTGTITHSVQYSAVGSQTNINIRLVPKGEGTLACTNVHTRQVGESANVAINSGGGFSRAGASAQRYKKNIEDYPKGLAEVLRLRPVTFETHSAYEAGKRFLGLIAEEVRDADLNELVIYENNEVEALRYDRVCVVLINAIKTLSEEIEALKAKIPA